MIRNNSNINTEDISAIILTYNEEKHIKRCILSIRKFVKKIIIIDSYSNDKTIQIAKKYKAKIYKHKFVNQSKQINWGIKNIKFTTKWLLRIDADEYLTKPLKDKVIIKLRSNDSNYSGISFNRKIKFINKEINFGITSPHKTLRIWKKNKGRCLDHWMDEQIIVNGDVIHINETLIDHNLNSFNWWKKKHINYAKREAINFFLMSNVFNIKNENKKNLKKINSQYKSKYNKTKIYYKIPIFIRPIFLFMYSYVLKLGFLNSWQGLIFNLYQVLWFRFLVDMNIYKIKKKLKSEKLQFKKVINNMYGFPKI